jgi:hypothetical protein
LGNADQTFVVVDYAGSTWGQFDRARSNRTRTTDYVLLDKAAGLIGEDFLVTFVDIAMWTPESKVIAIADPNLPVGWRIHLQIFHVTAELSGITDNRKRFRGRASNLDCDMGANLPSLGP